MFKALKEQLSSVISNSAMQIFINFFANLVRGMVIVKRKGDISPIILTFKIAIRSLDELKKPAYTARRFDY